MEKQVTIYTFTTCPFCIKAKELLDNEGIKYKEIEISDERSKLDDLESKTGYSTVPQIFAEDRFIGGCDDLLELHQNKEEFNNIFK